MANRARAEAQHQQRLAREQRIASLPEMTFDQFVSFVRKPAAESNLQFKLVPMEAGDFGRAIRRALRGDRGRFKYVRTHLGSRAGWGWRSPSTMRGYWVSRLAWVYEAGGDMEAVRGRHLSRNETVPIEWVKNPPGATGFNFSRRVQ